MASIQEYLDLIKNAIYGKDVRQAIHDGIQQCYYDGQAGAIDLSARQRLDTDEANITSLTSRMSTAENDINVLDSRVDQIVAPSGEAPSAAEVSDARVGADGTTYTSLGDAVRGQVTDLTHAHYRAETALTAADMVSGVWGDNGKRTDSTTRLRTAKSYKVTAGDKVVFSNGSMSNAQIAFKVFAKEVSTANNYTQSVLDASSWLSLNGGEYAIEHNGFIVYNVRFSNDATISTTDYSAEVSLIRQTPTEWAEIISDTKYYTDLVKDPLSKVFNINYLNEWVLGLYYNNDGTYESSRTDYICTKDKIPVIAGDSVVVSLNTAFNVQTLSVLWYDGNGNYLSYNTTGNTKRITATAPTNAKWFAVDVCKLYGETMVVSQYADATIFINPVASTALDFINGYLSTYNDTSFSTLMQSMFVLHYSHNGYGKYQQMDTRNAIIKPIRFPYAIKISCDSSHDFAYQYYSSRFNSNDTLTYASGWVRSVTIPANQWFCMIVRNHDESTTDNATTQSLVFEYDNTSFFVEEIEDARVDVDGNAYSTVGEHIRAVEDRFNSDFFTDYEVTSGFLKRSVNVKYLGGNLTYAQAFCKYNDKYYSTDGSNIAVQSSDFTLEQTVALSLGHGNSFQLGSSNLAYVSGWDNQKVYVVNLDTLTIDNIITLPTTGYTTVAVDDVNQLMYIFQRDSYPSTEDYYNFIVYDYANNQVISTKKTTVAFLGMQACDFVNGRIIVLNGFGTPTINGYRIYTTDGDIISEFVLGSISAQEPEGIFIDRARFDMFISTGGKRIYRVC